MTPRNAIVIVGNVDHTSGLDALAQAINASIDGKGRGLSLAVLMSALASQGLDPDANISAFEAWGMIVVNGDRFHLGPLGRAIAAGFYMAGND